MFLFAGNILLAQSGKNTVEYYSEDSLLITADLYIQSDTLPYLILMHEQGSSRGEFIPIIERFQKMNYNCLVPDLRNGGNSNFVANETAKRSRNYASNVEGIEGDILASIHYAASISTAPVLLLGAGANGSLALKAAMEMDTVKAAIALSPGEFFLNQFLMQDTLAALKKPVLATSTKLEFPYTEAMLSNVDEKYKELFVPENDEGRRGTEALLMDNPSHGEYWLAILLFFKELQ